MEDEGEMGVWMKEWDQLYVGCVKRERVEVRGVGTREWRERTFFFFFFGNIFAN